MVVACPGIQSVGVFCGIRPGTRPQHMALARQFGTALALRGAELVYGVSCTGVMSAVVDAALAAGAPVTAVIPHSLYEQEMRRNRRGAIFIVSSMHEHKALMYRLSEGFAVLPGGFETMAELMEVAAWNQLGVHDKPIVLVNHEGFFDPLLALLDHVVVEGFLVPAGRAVIRVASGADDALDVLGCATGELSRGLLRSAKEAHQ